MTVLGPLRPQRVFDAESHERETSWAAAVAAFGTPGHVRRFARWGCQARWGRIGLRIGLADYSVGTACRDGGFVQTAVMRSREWRTTRGLYVGDSVRRLRRLHPSAERHGDEWWLERAFSRIGSGGWYGTLVAVVRNGKVRSLRAVVGAAGD